MINALLAAMVVTCMPAPRRPPPPPVVVVTVRCEGVDQVRRDAHGVELGRTRDACRPAFGLSARG